MADTRLPLMTQALDTATPVRQMGIDQQNAALNHEQVLGQYYQNLDSREKSRLSSVISGAVQLETFLNNDDLEGAHEFLMRRRNSLMNRMGSGENIDTEDTDAAIQMIRTGKIDELKNTIQGLKAAGQVYGLVDKSDMPSNVQEWMYYNQLTPQEQEQYLTMKRSNQVVNLGGTQIVPSQVNPAGSPQATYDVTLQPEDQPENVKAKERAALEGRGETPENEKSQRGRTMVNNLVNQVIPKVEELGSTGGAINTEADTLTNVWAATKSSDVGQFVGRITGSQEQSIRNQIKTQKPALINAIRQATGMSAKAMDSNAELQFYLGQVGDEKTDTESQLFALKMINELYGNAGQPQMPGATATGVKVRVTDGKDIYEIDESDLQEALQDGMKKL